MNQKIALNDIVIMKKPHACGENAWQIIRLGADLKLRCVNCGHEIMMDRVEFNKKFKKKVEKTDAKK